MTWEGTYADMGCHYDNHSRKGSKCLFTWRDGVDLGGGPGGAGGAFILQVTPTYFLTEIRGSGGGYLGGVRFFWPIPYVYVFF